MKNKTRQNSNSVMAAANFLFQAQGAGGYSIATKNGMNRKRRTVIMKGMLCMKFCEIEVIGNENIIPIRE